MAMVLLLRLLLTMSTKTTKLFLRVQISVRQDYKKSDFSVGN